MKYFRPAISKFIFLIILLSTCPFVGCQDDNPISYSVTFENTSDTKMYDRKVRGWPGVPRTWYDDKCSNIKTPIPESITISWKSIIEGKEKEAENHFKKIDDKYYELLEAQGNREKEALLQAEYDELSKEKFPIDIFENQEVSLSLSGKVPPNPAGNNITITYIGNKKFDIKYQKVNRFITNSDLKNQNVVIKDGILDLSFSKITNKGLGLLKNKEEVKALDLTSTSVTDSGFKHFSEYPNLMALDLKYLQITGAGFANIQSEKIIHLNLESSTIQTQYLKNLNNCMNIEVLILINTDITDISGITNLKSLRFLNLAACPITDEGVKEIGKLENLEQLTLVQNEITDNSAQYLVKLSNLKSLRVGANNISDSAVQVLSSMPSLLYLELSGTNVSDNAIEYLIQFQKLECVNLRGTSFSAEGLKKLKNKCPDLEILTFTEY